MRVCAPSRSISSATSWSVPSSSGSRDDADTAASASRLSSVAMTTPSADSTMRALRVSAVRAGASPASTCVAGASVMNATLSRSSSVQAPAAPTSISAAAAPNVLRDGRGGPCLRAFITAVHPTPAACAPGTPPPGPGPFVPGPGPRPRPADDLGAGARGVGNLGVPRCGEPRGPRCGDLGVCGPRGSGPGLLSDGRAHPDLLGVDELADPVRSQLAAVAGSFDPARGQARIGLDDPVDRDLA